MAPATGTAILVLAAFVLPGFVALRYRERTYVTKEEDSPFERLLNALYFSFLTYVVIFAGAVVIGLDAADIGAFYGGERSLGAYVAFASAAFVAPLAIAEVARRWNGSQLRTTVLRRANINLAHATPSGWEHFFLQGTEAFVRVTLKDGRVVGGYFGNASFAGYTVETPDLFLEQRWALNADDWFVAPAAATRGIYLRAEAIVSVEFYAVDDPAPSPGI